MGCESSRKRSTIPSIPLIPSPASSFIFNPPVLNPLDQPTVVFINTYIKKKKKVMKAMMTYRRKLFSSSSFNLSDFTWLKDLKRHLVFFDFLFKLLRKTKRVVNNLDQKLGTREINYCISLVFYIIIIIIIFLY